MLQLILTMMRLLKYKLYAYSVNSADPNRPERGFSRSTRVNRISLWN